MSDDFVSSDIEITHPIGSIWLLPEPLMDGFAAHPWFTYIGTKAYVKVRVRSYYRETAGTIGVEVERVIEAGALRSVLPDWLHPVPREEESK